METLAPPQTDATVMAWWVEEAHGREGEDLYVVEGDEGRPALTTEPAGKNVLMKLKAQERRIKMGRPDNLYVRTGERQTDVLAQHLGMDALFWTSSAIEKFLIPYYYAQRLYTEIDIERFRQRCSSQKVVAVGHVQPSRERLIYDPTDSWLIGTADDRDEDKIQWTTLKEFLS